MYRERFPGLPSERIVVIENGFDEQAFPTADGQGEPAPLHPARTTLVHSGVVYPSERDPTQLFQALAMLKAEGAIDASGFVMRFRASEHDATLRRLA